MARIRVSDSGQFKNNVGDVQKKETKQNTDARVDATKDQEKFQFAYGADGAQLSGSQKTNYNPFATILPKPRIERNEYRKKKNWWEPEGEHEEEEEKEEEQPKKRSFWDDLFAED